MTFPHGPILNFLYVVTDTIVHNGGKTYENGRYVFLDILELRTNFDTIILLLKIKIFKYNNEKLQLTGINLSLSFLKSDNWLKSYIKLKLGCFEKFLKKIEL